MKGVKRWSSHIVIARRAEWTNAAIHRVSRDVVGFVRSVTGDQWIAAGLRPRDDKSVAFPFTLYPSIFTLLVSPLGSFGLAPPLAKTFLAYSLLAFLETDTEAAVDVAGTGVAEVAKS